MMIPKTKAVLYMGLANSIHFAGFELARSATLALFTSKRNGFTSPMATPLAIGLVSPISVLLLWIYTQWLNQHGPRYALRYTALTFAAIIGGGGLLLGILDMYLKNIELGNQGVHELPSSLSSSFFLWLHSIGLFPYTTRGMDAVLLSSRTILFVTFCLQNAYVNLLFTQHWSFLSSVYHTTTTTTTSSVKSSSSTTTSFHPKERQQQQHEAAVWFAPLAGLGSITSTTAAMAVKPLVAWMGLIPLLLMASLCLLLCAILGDNAYRIAHENGFAPKPSDDDHNDGNNPSPHKRNLNLQTGWNLLRQRPVLGALCFEVLSCQCLSSLVNFLFVLKLKESIPDDKVRAGWTGKCYGYINAASGLLQFAILPWLFKWVVEPGQCWVVMPCIMLASITLVLHHYERPSIQNDNFDPQQENSALFLVAASFFIMKTLEYSIRGVATQTLYVSLDYESRFLGKEMIGTVVTRFGKAGMSLALSGMTAWFGSSSSSSATGSSSGLLDRSLMWASQICSLLWLLASYRLSKLLSLPSENDKRQDDDATAGKSSKSINTCNQNHHDKLL